MAGPFRNWERILLTKKKIRLRGWVLPVLLLAIAAGIGWYLGRSTSPLPPSPAPGPGAPPGPTIEKSGAGAIADYTRISKAIHAAVDAALASAQLPVQDIKEEVREVPRRQVEGRIRWHVRQLFVAAPAEKSGGELEKILAPYLKPAAGEILAKEPDNYLGRPVLRLDVGYRGTLAGDPLSIVTDRIYVAREKPAVRQPRPEGPGKGDLAIIIDDFGYSPEPVAAFIALGRPLTFSVLPYLAYSTETAQKATAAGAQVIVHLPMEPLARNGPDDPGMITVAMSDAQIEEAAAKAFRAIPGAIGFNNHKGSRATADRRVMADVLKVAKSRGFFFIDSHTNVQSVGLEVAQELGLRAAGNDLFIDNSPDREAIKRMLETAKDIALRHGSAIVIGHARLSTAAAIRDMIPELEAAGVRLVFASQLVR